MEDLADELRTCGAGTGLLPNLLMIYNCNVYP
jgi:hypothetical protein